MFDSLEEQMKHDEQETTTPKERVMKWTVVAVVSIALFGGLYWGVSMLN